MQEKKIEIQLHFKEPPGVVVTPEEMDALAKITISFFQHALEILVAPKIAKLKRDPNPNGN